MGEGSGIVTAEALVTAVAWFPSLAGELLHAMVGMAKNKNKNKSKNPKVHGKEMTCPMCVALQCVVTEATDLHLDALGGYCGIQDTFALWHGLFLVSVSEYPVVMGPG